MTIRPQDQLRLVGHDAAQHAFLSAFNAQKLHHAWLICGIEGIGKATLAYRIAKFLLVQGEHLIADKAHTLQTSSDHPTVRKILAGAHPDLWVLSRAAATDKKAAAQFITVDEVRKAISFFQSTSAVGGYRVCIIDRLEDLNTNAANALLKLLEEPPAKTIFLLVTDAVGRILPTLRSRCRLLPLKPLTDAQVFEVLQTMQAHDDEIDANQESLMLAASKAEGSVKQALRLLLAGTLSVIERTEALLHPLPRLDPQALLSFAEYIQNMGVQSKAKRSAKENELTEKQDFLNLTLHTVERWLSTQIAQLPAAHAYALVQTWETVQQKAHDVAVFHLDKRPFIIGLFQEFAKNMCKS
jgi:DNA polymerase III subunit delta'